MKWIIAILVIIVAYAIYTDNMGGARDAASNYNKILRPQQ
jgi:heme A synthase